MQNAYENFIDTFDKVFMPDKTVKTVGRETCLSLIHQAYSLRYDMDFGDSVTGMMNIDNLYVLRNSIGRCYHCSDLTRIKNREDKFVCGDCNDIDHGAGWV